MPDLLLINCQNRMKMVSIYVIARLTIFFLEIVKIVKKQNDFRGVFKLAHLERSGQLDLLAAYWAKYFRTKCLNL